MIFDAASFGYAYGLVLLSFCLGLVIGTALDLLRLGQRSL